MAGLGWAATHCPAVPWLGKTDDNVVLDLPRLLDSLPGVEAGAGGGAVVCGAGPPHRNMRPLRSPKPRMLVLHC